MQKIDMGGFKNEEVEVTFGSDVYKIMLDPPIEIYRQLLEVQGKKLESEEDWQKVKKLVATIITYNNKEINVDEFANSLTKISVLKFINSYTNLLYKSSDLKNSLNPPSNPKETEESKEEKEN
jgi:hypothetical protein